MSMTDIFKAATGEPDHKAIFDWLSPSLEPAAGSMGAPAWGGPDSGPSPMAQTFNLAEQNKHLQSDIYNSMSVAATPGPLPMGTSRDDQPGRTGALPGWTAWRSSGVALATVVADTAWPGDNYVEMQFAETGTATTNNMALTTDLVPVRPGNQIAIETVTQENVPAGVTLNETMTARFYSAAGTFISSTTDAVDFGGSLGEHTNDWWPAALVPLNATYARLEFMAWETVAHNAATYCRFGSISMSQMPTTQSVSYNMYVDGGLVVDGNALIGIDSSYVGFFGSDGVTRQTVTGSRGGNAALASLLTALNAMGLITNSSTA